MKVKILNGILLVDVLTFLLILIISLIPDHPARVVLGLPFMLFSPGYSLVSAIFPTKQNMNNIESIALSIGMSIAIIPLLGLGLNYTPWGISINTILYSVSGFILLTSAVALTRQAIANEHIKYTIEFNLRLMNENRGIFSNSLTVVLFLSFITTIGILGYTVAVPKIGEKYTEFYVLGYHGEAQDYPSEFSLQNDKVVSVLYGRAGIEVPSSTGKITLGIVNQEQVTVTYSILLNIDEEKIDLIYQGRPVSELGSIILSPGEKWESEVEFAPSSPREKEKVEFLLYKDSSQEPYRDLHFWIDVKQIN